MFSIQGCIFLIIASCMTRVTVRAAKTNLSKLIRKACAGEDVVITKRGDPVIRLVPVTAEPPQRRFGAMRGRARVDERFFEPLSSAPANS